MNILYLAHRIPYPPNKGDKIRSFNEIKYLSQHHQVDLVCLVDEPADMQYKDDLEKYCRHVEVFPLNKTIAKLKGLFSLLCGGTISVGYFYQKKMQQSVDQLLQKNHYDAIFCFSSTMAEYVFKSSLKGTSARLVMDFCDVDSDKWLQYATDASFPMNYIYRLENRRLIKYEQKIYTFFDHSVLISVAEQKLFQQICSDDRKLSIVPNGVDFRFFDPDAIILEKMDNGLKLVFTGAMDYHANVDGVLWFHENIWPTLLKKYPHLTFYIIGSNPTAEVKALAEQNRVVVTGFVDDIRDYYAMADVCVVPLRMARGVQNKVLEAMSMQKALVTTSKANAGILAADGEQLLIADTADEFIEKVTYLLDHPDKADELAHSAREYVVERYDWDKNLQELEKTLKGD